LNRIETIVSNINNDDKVADIGCDQAEVSIMLAKKGIKSIASDISNNVINKANEKILKIKLENYIDLRVGNGLSSINANEVDTIILAGMGMHTIIDIISSTKYFFKKIITISNNKNDELRINMNKFNYKIFKETIIFENNKYYNLIVFVPGKYDYTEYEILFGYNQSDIKLFNKWKEFLLNKYTNIKKSSKNKNKKINKILYYLEKQ
jgi:tRNA (adenine22-N1)-methyltransferase